MQNNEKTFEERVTERANAISIPEIENLISVLEELLDFCVWTENFEPHVFQEKFSNMSFSPYNEYAKAVQSTLLITACDWSLLMEAIASLLSDIRQFEAALKQSKATCLVAQEIIRSEE